MWTISSLTSGNPLLRKTNRSRARWFSIRFILVLDLCGRMSFPSRLTKPSMSCHESCKLVQSEIWSKNINHITQHCTIWPKTLVDIYQTSCLSCPSRNLSKAESGTQNNPFETVRITEGIWLTKWSSPFPQQALRYQLATANIRIISLYITHQYSIMLHQSLLSILAQVYKTSRRKYPSHLSGKDTIYSVTLWIGHGTDTCAMYLKKTKQHNV